jgi:hypothetical protein
VANNTKETEPKPDADAPAPKGKPSVPKTIPMETEPAAARLLREKITREKREALAALKREAENNQFFLRCPRDREHHAAYLTENPVEDLIHPGMWFNLEHEVGEPWPHEYISCQECLFEGDTRRWNVPLLSIRMSNGSVAFRPMRTGREWKRDYVVGKVRRGGEKPELMAAHVGGGKEAS